uniref:Programmed cell death protein 5 n=1 Tax=Sus scrofa TaxID=9823 RepID=A0A8D0PAP7_PIG
MPGRCGRLRSGEGRARAPRGGRSSEWAKAWLRLLARDGRTMAEEELEALRKQRLAELQAKHGDPGDAAQQEAKHREAEMRNSILAQVLDQSARARLSNLALVKPEKTKAVENYLIQMARYGQLSGKIRRSPTCTERPSAATTACRDQPALNPLH